MEIDKYMKGAPMFDDDFMNDMLLNPDLYGMEDEDDQKNEYDDDEDDDDEDY